jgi:hypothetical protein
MKTPHTTDARIPSTKIERGDPRYRAVLDKRFNKRFSANPDYVCLVDSPEQVRVAVEEAVSEGRRVVVTSGGHCLEGFVSDPDVRVIVDVSPMKRIYYDADKRAIAVEAGVTVGEAFRALFETWGSTRRSEEPGLGSRVLSRPVRGDRRSSGSRRRIRWRADQPPRHRPG